MRKHYNISWRDSDEAELKRLVKNFNAKLTRLAKQNPKEKNALPERASVRDIKNLVETRQDLNRELNALRRFTKRGSEELVEVPDNDYNLKITKWQKEEMTRRVSIINRKRKKRYEAIKDMEMESRGESLGYTVEQAKEGIGMGTVDKNATEPMNAFTKRMTRADLKVKYQNILYESQSQYWNRREQIMKETYIRTLEENYGEVDISDIVEAIKEYDFTDFYKKFLKEGGRFEYHYPGDQNEEEDYAEALRSIWMPDYEGEQ